LGTWNVSSTSILEKEAAMSSPAHERIANIIRSGPGNVWWSFLRDVELIMLGVRPINCKDAEHSSLMPYDDFVKQYPPAECHALVEKILRENKKP
jgi:hypothetical protein